MQDRFDFLKDLPNWKGVYGYTTLGVKEILASHQTLGKASDDGHAKQWRDAWTKWIAHDNGLDFSGCQNKQQWAPCNGIHDALIQQIAHRARDFRQVISFEDDYQFYQNIIRPYEHKIIKWEELETIKLPSYFVISWPNHNGMLDDKLDRLVHLCRLTGSRIFLDCAFYGTINQGICNTGLEEIDAVAFSISKPFLCGGLRAGIVWGDNLAPTLTIPVNKDFHHNYYNVNGIACGTKILNATNARTIPGLFGHLQQQWCRQHNLIAADVVFFAINRGMEYESLYRSGGRYARVCLTDHYMKNLGQINDQ